MGSASQLLANADAGALDTKQAANTKGSSHFMCYTSHATFDGYVGSTFNSIDKELAEHLIFLTTGEC